MEQEKILMGQRELRRWHVIDKASMIMGRLRKLFVLIFPSLFEKNPRIS
jgi:hypothetical protein